MKRPTKLHKYFRLYNAKYFGGVLTEPVLQWAKLKHYGHFFGREINTYNVVTDELDATRLELVIELAEWTRGMNNVWRLTLLHEMVHLKLHNKRCKTHGKLFNDEMKRLANVGAMNGLW